MIAAGDFAGQLTSSTVHLDLTGRGRASALVGSSDGHLYLVDPCLARLDGALAFGAAVGEATYADTDGDGLDEILVTTGDGYLHALQHHALDAPTDVVDLDTSGSLADVDRIGDHEPPAASWSPVAGATGYQVALVDIEGVHQLDPAWRDVGDTRYTFDDVTTLPGDHFRVLVRAVGPDGNSVDAASDGVIVEAGGVVPPVDDGGCCDAGGGGPAGALALSLLVLATLRRRRC
jgi:uncharacterized protein (TIGR03382 family)